MWSSIWKNWKSNAIAFRMPIGVDGTGGPVKVPERAAGKPKLQKQQQQQAGDGKKQRASQKNQQGFVKETREQQPVIMAAAAKVAKRVPLIRFPNRKVGETQGAQVAVNRASGGGQSQAMSQATSQASLPSGTASSQPPRTKLTEAEIDAILLGGAAP